MISYYLGLLTIVAGDGEEGGGGGIGLVGFSFGVELSV